MLRQGQQQRTARAIVEIRRADPPPHLNKLGREGDRRCYFYRLAVGLNVEVISTANHVVRTGLMLGAHANQAIAWTIGSMQAHRCAVQRLDVDTADGHYAQRTIRQTALHHQAYRIHMSQDSQVWYAFAKARDDVAQAIDLHFIGVGRQALGHDSYHSVFIASQARDSAQAAQIVGEHLVQSAHGAGSSCSDWCKVARRIEAAMA